MASTILLAAGYREARLETLAPAVSFVGEMDVTG